MPRSLDRVSTLFQSGVRRALRLARDPAYLAALKDRLIRNRDGSPLFDTQRATRHIETAYQTMAEIGRRNEKPRGFNVV
jgi:predicted O-linked N-acetylglucosamine transferase (SPINDLY family)